MTRMTFPSPMLRLCAVGALAMASMAPFAWYGGDKAEDRILYAAGQATGATPVKATESQPVSVAPQLGSIVTAPHWLCMSQRDGQERRFAIAHQRESDHEWEIQCAYGPAFPGGGI